MTTSDITACVCDNGIFLPVARRLGRDYKKVYYWSPSTKAFPTVRDCIGDGFTDIERVDSLSSIKDECQLFVFPDIGMAGTQLELISQGYHVWGARDGDSLEISRGKFLDTLLRTNLPVPKYTRVVGMAALRDHLKDVEDRYIKISKFRGDWETLHWRNWRQDETELDAAAVRFGPWKELVPFYVFEPIDTDIEDGCDSFCIDGQWPKTCIHGMESKDKSYLGAFQDFTDLDERIRVVNDEFGPILKEYGYRGFFSTEVRITTDGESYFIDPCCRGGSPPSQVQCEMIANYGEMIWQGAQGNLVDPEPAAPFGVQAIVSAKGDRRNNWCAVEIPPELDRWFKAGFCAFIDGRYAFPPDPTNNSNDIGWITATGDTPKAAIDALKEHAALLPDGLTASVESLADLIVEAEKAKDQGIELTDKPLPPPAEVIEDKP